MAKVSFIKLSRLYDEFERKATGISFKEWLQRMGYDPEEASEMSLLYLGE